MIEECVERIMQVIRQRDDYVDLLIRRELRDAHIATLEEAAKVCDVIEDKLTEQWKAGYKVCDYTQGASDGANDCAAAIRALQDKA